MVACDVSSTRNSTDFSKEPSALATTSQGSQNDDPMRMPVYANENDISFKRISVEQGLSHSTVGCIFRDNRGFMWFCTQDGLNRYDGAGFKVYKHDPDNPNSLSHNEISALVEDPEGMLWIGTGGGGLNKYDRHTDTYTHYMHNPYDSTSLTDDWVTSLYVDEDGVLWIGTGRGLDKLDPMTEGFIHYQPNSDDPHSLGGLATETVAIETIYQDGEGLLWIGTNGNGLIRFDPDTERFTNFQHDPNNPHSLISNYLVSAIFEDSGGDLWIGTFDGLDRLDRQTGHFVHYQHDPDKPGSLSNNVILSLFEDRSGGLWVGTRGGGLNKFDRESGQFIHYRNNPKDTHSLSSNVVTSIYEDWTGGVWIGTAGGGLNRVDPSTKHFVHFQNDPDTFNSLSSNLVWSILEDRTGRLWIGTLGGGLNRYDRDTNEWRQYQHAPDDPNSLSNNNVSAIHEDQSGALWIGTAGSGLDRFDPQTGIFTHYPPDPDDPHSLGNPFVYSIIEDQEGMLWVATDEGIQGGLHRLDPETGLFTHYKQNNNWVRALYEDRSGVIWIGTNGNGLNRFDPDTELFTHFQHDANDAYSLSQDGVTAIYEDGQGTLWIGTSGGGLNKFDREKESFTHYRVEDGLPSDAIYGILEEASEPDSQGSQLWISTNNGLSKFDLRTGTFRNYDTSDGLQSNEFIARAYHQSESGEMFFGGVNGFNAFYPAFVKDNPNIPPVVLTSIRQNGHEVQSDTAVESLEAATFRWPDNSFEFEFAALNFIQPEKNQYAYKLEGFDKDWNDIGNRRFGKYTNLPGGTYTLLMKASNNDGIWNEEGTSVTITVVPPFWESWWFRGIAFLALFGAVFASYRLRVRSIEARSRELEDEVKQRTAALEVETEQRLRAEEALRRSETEKAVTAERNRFARELHDAVSQTLFSASLIAEALPTSWERDQQEGRLLLAKLRQLSRGALAEMRTLLMELRPSALVETSLEDLLRQLAEATTGREGLPVDIQVECECDLPADVHIALYRIAQEAMNNVIKHARASQVEMRLDCTACAPVETESQHLKRTTLSVTDNGEGFDPEDIPSDHLGIGIMHERAASIGAMIAIVSQPGEGTRVTVIWEVNNEGESDEHTEKNSPDDR